MSANEPSNNKRMAQGHKTKRNRDRDTEAESA